MSNKLNIIIPMNGLGSRFSENGYIDSKPLVRINGNHMVCEVINSLNISSEDSIYLIYNKKLDSYNFKNLIKKYNPGKNINFLKLNFDTRGAAETVYAGLNSIADISGSFMLIDCDTIHSEDIIEKYKNKWGNNIFYFEDSGDEPIYSYIEINKKNNKVTNIAEKKKISSNANLGVYCFESGNVLKKYCEKILNSNKRQNKEFYISGLYKEMISDNIDVFSTKIHKFYSVGVPYKLQSYASSKISENKKRICFDIDNTLLNYPEVPGDYSTCTPIKRNVDFLNFLKDNGHYIILYTARRMKTFGGNLGKVLCDTGKITLDSLNKHGIAYDEIYFGKPYADMYIDDLSANPSFCLQKQTGFYNNNISPRYFNLITFKENKVIKQGDLSGESFWYKNIPKTFYNFIPTIYQSSEKEIVMEKINGIPVSYLYINKSFTFKNLSDILAAIDKLHSFSINEKDYIDIYGNYSKKINKRYNNAIYSKFLDSKIYFDKIIKLLLKYESKNLGSVSIIHGDPVFTNIFLKNDGCLNFIDPRGSIANKRTIYGDSTYDYAKIYQSLNGYDNILLDSNIDQLYCENNIKYFEKYIIKKFNKEKLFWIKVISASLLFSLIPLHNNKKCNEYYNIMKKIFLDLEKYKEFYNE